MSQSNLDNDTAPPPPPLGAGERSHQNVWTLARYMNSEFMGFMNSKKQQFGSLNSKISR